MRNTRETSEPLRWQEDPSFVLAAVEAETGGASLGVVGLEATDSDGWHYRAIVRERGGRLFVASMSVEADGARGNLSDKLRVPVQPILDFAAKREAERRKPPQEAIRRSILAGARWLAKENPDGLRQGWADAGEDPDSFPDDFVATLDRDLEGTIFPPGSFFPADAVARMDERDMQAARKGRGDPKDEQFYAHIAVGYLQVSRTNDSPHPKIAAGFKESGYGPDLTLEQVTARVRGWVNYAGKRYGFLQFSGRGKTGAKPTPKLRAWAKAHPDDNQAQWFLQTFPTKGEKR